jgi:amino acid adenylation domain-containing protein
VWEEVHEPVQVVWREAEIPVEEVILQRIGGFAEEELTKQFDPRNYRMDVSRAPLMRAYIAPDGDRWLLLTLNHHLIGDHTTLEVMREEIQAHLLGGERELPKPMPFRNFVAQARLGISAEEHEEFFRGMLGEVDEPTAPFGVLDVQGDGSGIQQSRMEVGRELGGRLRQGARRLGVSVASLCHLAWGQVLARVSGKDDVVFGTVLFGRMQGGAGADRVMGLFINTLPIRIKFGQESVTEAVRRTQASLSGLIRHEHASLALAQRCSGVEAPAALFTALLNYRHSTVWRPEIRSAEAKQAWQGIEAFAVEERTNYPVSLDVDDFGDWFGLTAQVRAPLDPERLCNFMHRALEQLVEALETSPQKPIRELDVLPEAERAQVIEEWNATEREYPSERCIHALFEEQVARQPEATAVVYQDERLSYEELNQRANRVAHRLVGLGVKPDDRVAICLERNLEMVVGVLGILKAGGAYVPLDPAYPVERLRYILEDSRPTALLTEGKLLHKGVLPSLPGDLPIVDLTAPEAGWPNPPTNNLTLDAIGLTARHLAYIIYTSGSTGRPKGAMIEHEQLVNRILALRTRYGLSDRDRVLQFASLTFDASVEEIFGTFLAGATLILRTDAWISNGTEIQKQCSTQGITVLDLPTRFWQTICRELAQPVTGIRLIIIGGEAVDPTALRAWFDIARHSPTLLNTYGPTEVTIVATAAELTGDASLWNAIGKPVSNTRLYILDYCGRPAPIGVTGEIYIGGAGIARGYLNRPEFTAERFLADPFSKELGARMYRTGDLGRWLLDGNIEFLGRNDFQVKIRGFRIELGEIEARLREQEGVAEALVAAREDSAGEKRLVAYYVSSEADGAAGAITSDKLRAQLAAQLPEYMLPVAYVRLEAFPVTPNGKLDRKALPEPGQEAFVTHHYEAPEGEVECILARIWEEVLKVERVGRHDNFFALGGHSLLAITIMERMRRQGLSSEVRTLFAAPTLADLARQTKEMREIRL